MYLFLYLLLKVSINPDDEACIERLERQFVRGNNECSRQGGEATTDAYKRLLKMCIRDRIKADSWRFESARERYNLLLETHPEIIKRAPLAHIASYLLMTPETL